jgi:superfamily I DNA/RNA helicase
VPPNQIGILYRKKMRKDSAVLIEFTKELNKVAPVTWLTQDSSSRKRVFEQTIKIQTVDSAKGLQYKVVFVMWGDLFDPLNPSDRDQEQRRLYVALTRPEDVLIITYSQPSAFIEKMVESGDAVCK